MRFDSMKVNNTIKYLLSVTGSVDEVRWVATYKAVHNHLHGLGPSRVLGPFDHERAVAPR